MCLKIYKYKGPFVAGIVFLTGRFVEGFVLLFNPVTHGVNEL